MEDDMTLLSCLDTLSSHGLTVLEGAPRREDVLRDVSRRVGPLKITDYGDIFDVQTKTSPNNVAYTSGYLGLHTDQPYYRYVVRH